jgi:hypothetical protein
MRILRVRRGFQADHSSSSYLFYAVDHPVSAEGRAVARRYSSRAEVYDRTVRYQKWGDSELNSQAYQALLGAHYDVMVSESYDWWTLMIALPKTAQMQAMLAPFADARGYDDQGVEVEDYGKRLVVIVYCAFEGNGVEFAGDHYFYSGRFPWLRRGPSLNWRFVLERRAGSSSDSDTVWRSSP